MILNFVFSDSCCLTRHTRKRSLEAAQANWPQPSLSDLVQVAAFYIFPYDPSDRRLSTHSGCSLSSPLKSLECLTRVTLPWTTRQGFSVANSVAWVDLWHRIDPCGETALSQFPDYCQGLHLRGPAFYESFLLQACHTHVSTVTLLYVHINKLRIKLARKRSTILAYISDQDDIGLMRGNTAETDKKIDPNIYNISSNGYTIVEDFDVKFVNYSEKKNIPKIHIFSTKSRLKASAILSSSNSIISDTNRLTMLNLSCMAPRLIETVPRHKSLIFPYPFHHIHSQKQLICRLYNLTDTTYARFCSKCSK